MSGLVTPWTQALGGWGTWAARSPSPSLAQPISSGFSELQPFLINPGISSVSWVHWSHQFSRFPETLRYSSKLIETKNRGPWSPRCISCGSEAQVRNWCLTWGPGESPRTAPLPSPSAGCRSAAQMVPELSGTGPQLVLGRAGGGRSPPQELGQLSLPQQCYLPVITAAAFSHARFPARPSYGFLVLYHFDISSLSALIHLT